MPKKAISLRGYHVYLGNYPNVLREEIAFIKKAMGINKDVYGMIDPTIKDANPALRDLYNRL